MIAACRTGDRAAAEVLVRRYWERVYAFAYRLSLNASDAEDIAQETFLRALARLAQFSDGTSFKAWLLRIASNLFLDARKATRSREVSSDFTAACAPGFEPQEQMLLQEQLGLLYREIGTLPRPQRLALLLRMVENCSYPEIAQMLETAESTVRWHVYEARRILRLRLEHVLAAENAEDDV